jgi:hypothetical protein
VKVVLVGCLGVKERLSLGMLGSLAGLYISIQ